MGAGGGKDRHRRKFRRKRAISPGTGAAARQLERRFSTNIRRCLGVDPKLLLTISRLSGGSGRAWRIQRQVHVQSIRAAWRFLRDVAHPHSQNLSELLSTRLTVAIHRYPFGGGSLVNNK